MAVNKKVILFVVDSFHPLALKKCLESNLVPALDFIISKGSFFDSCVSVFPTMTPTCSSSIATGTLASQHQIPGLVWFNRRENRIVNYGASKWAVFKQGISRVIQDLMYNLNNVQLSKKVKTIYESLEQAGFSTGAVNPYIFRAGRGYGTRIPLVMKIATLFNLGGQVWGPQILYLGQFIPPPGMGKTIMAGSHYFRKFGINDDYSGTVTEWIIRGGKQPDLLSVYLPDTDGYAHRRDPVHTEPSLRRVDRQLRKVLNCFGSWEEALKKNIFIITGDHSQSLVEASKDALVDIPALLKGFSQVRLGENFTAGKELAICVNERMCHIYLLKGNKQLKRAVLKALSRHPGVDQVAWRENGWCMVRAGEQRKMSFRPGAGFRDQYSQGWDIQGDPRVLDLSLSGDRVRYGNYPDAMNRLLSILECEQAGDVVLTARPGYEFVDDYSPSHRGCGSHGSLDAGDSLVPLVVSGSDIGLRNPRLQDIAGLIRSHFGLY